MGKNKDYREISRNNWKIKGVFFGNNGMVMRYAQRITKSSLGLLFSRSGNKQKKLGSSKVNIRIKKDLMKHGECVLHKVFISYLVLGFLRISFLALFRGREDGLGCPISYSIIPTRRIKSISKLFCLENIIRGGFI